jgi:hypothetical protein
VNVRRTCSHRQGPLPTTQPDNAMHMPILATNRQMFIIAAPNLKSAPSAR